VTGEGSPPPGAPDGGGPGPPERTRDGVGVAPRPPVGAEASPPFAPPHAGAAAAAAGRSSDEAHPGGETAAPAAETGAGPAGGRRRRKGRKKAAPPRASEEGGGASSDEEGGEGPDDAATGGASRPPLDWAKLSPRATLAGWGCLGALGWAVFNRLDRWEAAPFVLLLYGALAGAAAAAYAARRAKVRPEGSLRTLWTVLAILFLWVWFPPSRYVVGWLYRRVAIYFLS
jgi:hypothetical protein